jgi:multidrug efflux system outer membrane protein
MPTGWRFKSDDGSTLCNLRWWESLNDPILNNLIETALQNNKDLQIAIWRVKEYWGQYEIVRSGLFPQVDFEGSALKQRFPTNAGLLDFLPQGTNFNPILPDYKGVFNLSYELDFWGQVRNETFAAYNEYLAQIENRRTVVLSLVGAVAQAYILLRRLDLELSISRQTLQTRKESLQIARLRFEGGLTSEIEVTQAASAYEEALIAVAVYERQIPQQENLLSVLLGQSPHDIVRGKAIYEFNLEAEVPAGLPCDLLTRRPDIVGAENILIAANANIGVARAAFFPQFNLTGFYGRESSALKSFFTKPAKTWQIGGDFIQQIFTGGRLFGQLDVAKAQQQEALFQYEQTILNALREVDDSLIGFQQSKEIFAASTDDVIALQEYVRLSWLRYYEGQTQYLTVLDAERTLFTAQINLAQAQADQFLTLVDLYKALGGGWVIDADSQLSLPDDDAPPAPLIPAQALIVNPLTINQLRRATQRRQAAKTRRKTRRKTQRKMSRHGPNLRHLNTCRSVTKHHL